MDKAFSMGSMFGKFHYLTSWFEVALVPKRMSMVMKKNVSRCEILLFFFEKLLSFVLVEIFVLLLGIYRDILLRILSCFLFWIVNRQTLEFKLHSRILFFELIHRVTLPNFFVFLGINSSLNPQKIKFTY